MLQVAWDGRESYEDWARDAYRVAQYGEQAKDYHDYARDTYARLEKALGEQAFYDFMHL